MTNLLEETEERLNECGYSLDDPDIVIRCQKKRVPVEVFRSIASGTEYDSGYGGSEIDGSLKIFVGHHLFVRAVYDGAEWWEAIDTSIPTETWTGDSFTRNGWDRVDDDGSIGGE